MIAAANSGPTNWWGWILFVGIWAALFALWFVVMYAIGNPVGFFKSVWNWVLRPILLVVGLVIAAPVIGCVALARSLSEASARSPAMIRRAELERAAAVSYRIEASAQEAIEHMRRHGEALERARQH